jgi:hypothetical protein
MPKAKTKAKQVVKQKETTGTIFEWARKELQKAEDLLFKRKYEIVLETARKLDESGLVETEKITMEIIKGLKGFVDDQYVREVLKDYPQYKDQSQMNRAKGKKDKKETGSEIRAESEEPSDTNDTLHTSSSTENDDDAPTGYYQMAPEEYDINAVEQYDRAFLIKLVYYLHEELGKALKAK